MVLRLDRGEDRGWILVRGDLVGLYGDILGVVGQGAVEVFAAIGVFQPSTCTLGANICRILQRGGIDSGGIRISIVVTL